MNEVTKKIKTLCSDKNISTEELAERSGLTLEQIQLIDSSDKIPSLVSFITGPSRTADIEKTLVMGMHGPKEVYLFLIDDTVYE